MEILWKRLINRLVWIGFVFGCLLGLNGCQSPRPILSRAVVLNSTPIIIQDVSVQHMPTRKIASASAILSGRTLDIGFSPQAMMADSAVVTWKENGVAREVKLKIPAAPMDNSSEFMLVYEIEPHGNVSVYFAEEYK
jgi:hypothetical protein